MFLLFLCLVTSKKKIFSFFLAHFRVVAGTRFYSTFYTPRSRGQQVVSAFSTLGPKYVRPQRDSALARFGLRYLVVSALLINYCCFNKCVCYSNFCVVVFGNGVCPLSSTSKFPSIKIINRPFTKGYKFNDEIIIRQIRVNIENEEN